MAKAKKKRIDLTDDIKDALKKVMKDNDRCMNVLTVAITHSKRQEKVEDLQTQVICFGNNASKDPMVAVEHGAHLNEGNQEWAKITAKMVVKAAMADDDDDDCDCDSDEENDDYEVHVVEKKKVSKVLDMIFDKIKESK